MNIKNDKGITLIILVVTIIVMIILSSIFILNTVNNGTINKAENIVDLNNELINNKVESLLLEVRADNAPALALYERQGFVVIHKRKSYYQLPHRPAIDALIMQRFYD